MKINVLLALLVGAAVGFAAGFTVGGHPTAPSAPTADINNSRAAPHPTPAPPRPIDMTVFKVPVEASPTEGSKDAPVTIVEISDYQCPFCGRGNVTISQLQKDYGQKLRVVMKQNPLSFHPFAKPAALAALAAGEQGKYWEMHRKLFENQQALTEPDLEKYAAELGLNLEKWKNDRGNPKLTQIIAKDQALAASMGATGTPAFFINGRKISGAQPIEVFKTVIDEELVKASSLSQQGVPADQVYARTIEKGTTAPVAQAPAEGPPKKIDVPSDSPVWGAKNAPVTIVEWSDFQCPFCSRVTPTLEQIKKAYPTNVRLVFRNEPLPFHNNAQLAAEASMAAHEQGKFWAYHDKLFANQNALDRPSLEKYAQEIGLNMAKFKAGLDQGKFKARVQQDASAGAAAGANGTPNFFINGRQLVGAQPFESFKAVIDQELAKSKVTAQAKLTR